MIFRAGYTLLLWLGLPLILSRLWWRARREPGYAKGVSERFGRYGPKPDRPVIWVHAVSVGEVRASVPLVNALRAEYPEHSVLVTCMTAAGRETIKQAFGANVLAAFLPYDFPFAVRLFLYHFQPRIGVLVETEIWIDLMAECGRRKLPMVLASGRMSGRSGHAYRRLSGLTRPAFESLAAVCAQSEADATRIASLGAHQVGVAGNLKFDVVPEPAMLARGAELRRSLGDRRVVLLASTRDGEEDLLLGALAGRMPPGTLLMVVPRHPQRFDEVSSILETRGLKVARRSRGDDASSADALLGDTMGEMPAYYSAADVAIIGGSMLPYGGQNLIEACAIGVPVVIGPHVQNFSEVVRLAVEAGAAIQVTDSEGAVEAVLALLGDKARRDRMGSGGVDLCVAHRGATARHLAVIKRLLQP